MKKLAILLLCLMGLISFQAVAYTSSGKSSSFGSSSAKSTPSYSAPKSAPSYSTPGNTSKPVIPSKPLSSGRAVMFGSATVATAIATTPAPTVAVDNKPKPLFAAGTTSVDLNKPTVLPPATPSKDEQAVAAFKAKNTAPSLAPVVTQATQSRPTTIIVTKQAPPIVHYAYIPVAPVYYNNPPQSSPTQPIKLQPLTTEPGESHWVAWTIGSLIFGAFIIGGLMYLGRRV